MAGLLYRIGKNAFAHPFRFLGVWLVLLAVIGGSLAISSPKLMNDVNINGTPSQKLIDKLERDLPEAAGGQAAIVYSAPDGQNFFDGRTVTPVARSVANTYDAPDVVNPADAAHGQDGAEQAAQAEEQVEQAKQALAAARQGKELDQPVPLVVDDQVVPGAVIAPDGQAVLFQFQFTKQTFELADDATDNVIAAAEQPTEGTGISVYPGESLQGLPEVAGIGEAVGIAVAAVVLVIALGSFVAAGLPLMTALIGVGAGVGGAYALGHFYELGSVSVVLGLMLGLAVGIDYALFIVNRQRQLIMRESISAREATGRAVGTAGSAVFFAGATVIIALVALLVIGIGLLSTMALIAAGTVAVAVLVALTALPALLGLVGERIVTPAARAKAEQRAANGEESRTARRWVTLVSKHRVMAAVGVVVIAAVAAIPALDMRMGLPSGKSYNSDTAQRQSYDIISDSFGEGLNGPLLVVLSSDTPVEQQTVHAVLQDVRDVGGVVSASPAGMSDDGRTVIASVVPEGGPTDASTEDVVHDLRDKSAGFSETYGVELGVTGQTAMGIDIAEKMGDVMPVYLGIVLVLSLIVLTVVFRSVIVPVKATIGFLLTITATLGITTAVFQWGWVNQLFGLDSTAPVMALLPILATGIAYGLAMDYQVFLVSSMRESWVHGDAGRQSVINGFSNSSRVVAAAGIIMVSVFAGFIFNGDPMVKQIGFALAVAILIDAFLVRMTLVPALMSIFSDRAWRLPPWLDRLLPNLDIEGEKLLEALDAQDSEERVAQLTRG